MAYLESGKNVWISDSDFAYNIAFFAAGGTASMRSKGWGACEPVYGSLERMVCLGLNAKHYHVNAYAYGGVHIFYGYQAVNFTM